MRSSRVVDELLDDISRVLPCTTQADITQKVNELRAEEGRGDIEVPNHSIGYALQRLRWFATTDPERYGWTVGYAQRGVNDNDALRFNIIVLNDSSANFYGGTEKFNEANLGIASTFSANAQMFAHVGAYTEALVDSPGMDHNDNELFKRYVRFCAVLVDLSRDIAARAKDAAAA